MFNTLRNKILVWLAAAILPALAIGAFSLFFVQDRLSGGVDQKPVVEIQNFSILAFILIILVIALFFVLVLVPLADRLSNTAVAAEKVANGQHSAALADGSQDELGKIRQSFDQMARVLADETRKRQKLEKHIHYQATHDSLTDLHNRESMAEFLNQLSAVAVAKKHTIIFLGLHRLKPVNDTFGHAAGDQILQAISLRLHNAIESVGIVARWGGDEFVVALPNNDHQQALPWLAQIEAVFDSEIITDGQRHQVTCSSGMACSDGKLTLIRTLEQADIEMHRQKEQRQIDRLPKAA